MEIRKAILTGGGRATRLHPITTTINKHLLPLANKPMIFHAIEKAVESGIREIYINVNPGETELQKHIGDGGHWGIKIQYFEQTGGPQGIAHVVNEAKQFIGDDPFMFYLSDNILLGSLREIIQKFNEGGHDCMLALSEVPDPERFGVPVFDESGTKLIDVLEKPVNPPNNFAVTGIYLYGPKVFFESYKNIQPSARGEYEISSIHSDFLKRGLSVGYKEITGWWKDTGKSNDLLLASKLLLENIPEKDYIQYSHIGNTSSVEGKVHIGVGTRILENVHITGPVIIGENCVLNDCTLGPDVTLGSGVEIQKAKISNSIILENSVLSIPMHITGSIIGKNVSIVQKPDVGTEEGREMIIGDKTYIEL
ncbi:MAG: glucose-1-phosphate thymidylyltransferase [Candidatus Magasanikbacteria bacterium]